MPLIGLTNDGASLSGKNRGRQRKEMKIRPAIRVGHEDPASGTISLPDHKRTEMVQSVTKRPAVVHRQKSSPRQHGDQKHRETP